LESQKNTIDIELNERLRRRENELRMRLENMAEDEDGENPTDDLETRKRQLKALNKSIDTLTKKTEGNESSLRSTSLLTCL
jgi:structural maintenance of chromosome 3 (chondroitin sulfate proteoglycan 6)